MKQTLDTKPMLHHSGASRAGDVAVSFVIPVRNDATGLKRCLRSIARAAAAAAVPIECIVVDNGSTDDSARVAEAAGCRVLVVPNERVGSLRNRAAAIARGALLAFIDADHEISSAWISCAIRTLADRSISATGAPCHAPREATWVQRAYDGLRDHRAEPRAVEWLGSGNLVVRSGLFRQIGGFDPALEACEDVDLCRRIRQAGGRIVSDPQLENVHHGDPASLPNLFKGELWRGRNNLHVSLRERPSLRALPSIVIPVAQLAGMTGAAVAALTGFWGAAGLAILLACPPSLFRALRMQRRAGIQFSEALAVALTYDVARALALLVRAGHRRALPATLVASR